MKVESSSLHGYSNVNIMAGNNYENVFDLTYDVVNAIKKKFLVEHIEKMKSKIVTDKKM